MRGRPNGSKNKSVVHIPARQDDRRKVCYIIVHYIGTRVCAVCVPKCNFETEKRKTTQRRDDRKSGARTVVGDFDGTRTPDVLFRLVFEVTAAAVVVYREMRFQI